MPRFRRRLGYRGSWFAVASELPLTGSISHKRLAGLVRAFLRRPAAAAALVGLLLRTKTEHVGLSESRAGRAVRAYLDERTARVFPQNRWCRGVLVLPSDHAQYLRGRRRQALRTNLHHAARVGVACETIDDDGAALTAAAEILSRRRAGVSAADRGALRVAWPALFARPEVTQLLARDGSSRPLALAAVVIDDEICLIELAVASSHEARWALHDHLVKLLIDRGVRYLFSEGMGPFGALGFTPDIHHYQHLLGYELRHLVPVRRAPLRHHL